MIRAGKLSALRWLWLLLLPLPSILAYAESGDPLGDMRDISNRAAKEDRLPIAHPADAAWTSCAPVAERRDARCGALSRAN